MASELGPMTVTITSDGAICNMDHTSRIAALEAENAKLRDTVASAPDPRIAVLKAALDKIRLIAEEEYPVSIGNQWAWVSVHESAREALEHTKAAAFILQERIDGVHRWLELEHPEVMREQAHLDDKSTERAYWHYGYLAATRDARNLLLELPIQPEIERH